MKDLRSLLIDAVIVVAGIFVMFGLLLCGCTTQPLRGGKAMTLHKPAGGIEQTLMQSDNPRNPRGKIKRRCGRAVTPCPSARNSTCAAHRMAMMLA